MQRQVRLQLHDLDAMVRAGAVLVEIHEPVLVVVDVAFPSFAWSPVVKNFLFSTPALMPLILKDLMAARLISMVSSFAEKSVMVSYWPFFTGVSNTNTSLPLPPVRVSFPAPP